MLLRSHPVWHAAEHPVFYNNYLCSWNYPAPHRIKWEQEGNWCLAHTVHHVRAHTKWEVKPPDSTPKKQPLPPYTRQGFFLVPITGGLKFSGSGNNSFTSQNLQGWCFPKGCLTFFLFLIIRWSNRLPLWRSGHQWSRFCSSLKEPRRIFYWSHITHDPVNSNITRHCGGPRTRGEIPGRFFRNGHNFFPHQ